MICSFVIICSSYIDHSDMIQCSPTPDPRIVDGEFNDETSKSSTRTVPLVEDHGKMSISELNRRMTNIRRRRSISIFTLAPKEQTLIHRYETLPQKESLWGLHDGPSKQRGQNHSKTSNSFSGFGQATVTTTVETPIPSKHDQNKWLRYWKWLFFSDVVCLANGRRK